MEASDMNQYSPAVDEKHPVLVAEMLTYVWAEAVALNSSSGSTHYLLEN